MAFFLFSLITLICLIDHDLRRIRFFHRSIFKQFIVLLYIFERIEQLWNLIIPFHGNVCQLFH